MTPKIALQRPNGTLGCATDRQSSFVKQTVLAPLLSNHVALSSPLVFKRPTCRRTKPASGAGRFLKCTMTSFARFVSRDNPAVVCGRAQSDGLGGSGANRKTVSPLYIGTSPACPFVTRKGLTCVAFTSPCIVW